MNKKGRRTGITMNKKLGSTLIAMTIIIFMLFLTLGMFTKNFGGSASAEVASAQTSIVEETLNKDNVDENSSGTYTFSVKNTNKDGTKQTEVAVKYAIYVETKYTDSEGNNISGTVRYKLYRIDGNNKTEITAGNAIDGFSDSTMKFGTGSNEVHKYELQFTPDKVGKFNFKVKVKSEQID